MRASRKMLVGAVYGAALVLVVGCVLAAWVAYRTFTDATRISASQFRQSADQLSLELTDRLVIPAYGLGGLRGLTLALQRRPDVAEFRRAVDARRLSREFPGVYGFGFIEHVRADQLSDFVARVQAQYTRPFAVQTKGRPADLYVIRSIEPIEQNRAALGLDVASEPVREQAALAAIRMQALSVSGPIHLLQGDRDAFGALYYLPVFYSPPEPDPAKLVTPELLGIVYAAVDYPRVLSPLSAADRFLDFSLADVTDTVPVVIYPAESERQEATHALFRQEVALEVGGRQYLLTMTSTPAFDRSAQVAAAQARRIGLMGGAVSLMMALVAWLLIAGRQRAVNLAGSMTAELDRLATVARLTNDAVAIIDLHGRAVWTNPAFGRLTGYEPAEALDQRLCLLLDQRKEDSDACSTILAAAQSGAPFQGEASMRRRDGELIWTELEVQPVTDRDGVPQGSIVILSNISQRRAMEQALRESRAFLDRTGTVAGVGGWQVDLDTRAITWSEQTRRIYEVPDDFVPRYESLIGFFPPRARGSIQAAIARALENGTSWDLELPFITYHERTIWVRTLGTAEFEDGRPARLTGTLQDISRGKLAEIALAENRELLRVTLNSIGDAVVTTDEHALVTWMNPVAEALTGWSAASAQGRPVSEVLQLVNEEGGRAADNPVHKALGEERIVGLARNTVLVSRDGAEYGVEDSAAPIKDSAGHLVGAVMVFHDVTASRELAREISHQARHDALTGLPNRFEFKERLVRFMARVQHADEIGAVMFIDLDHFKIVNDSCGHHAGDELLCQIAGLLTSSVRSLDVVARFGGDEFVVLLENCTREQSERIAQKVCDAVDRYRYIASSEQGFRVGTSIGVVLVDPSWRDADDVIRAADTSCYIAKSQGRNRFHTWQAQDARVHAHVGDSAWGARIETALDEHGFVLYGQRIRALSPRALGETERWHAEVLLRMVESDGSIIAPGVFMPAAERYQLASRIDRWVVQAVFDRLAQADEGSLPDLLAINLSGQSISDRAFHHFIKGLVDRARFDVRMLCFEITETAAITNLADARSFLEAMRKRGIRIALDDFGAGVSSFGYLKHLPVDYLKIDGQFVLGLATDPLDQVSVRSFCEVAAVLGIQTVAEYVERDELLVILKTLKVDYAQGFMIHRPEPLERLFGAPVLA